ncbi:MAG: hypothetical protein AAGE52_25590 [Myxococcota bacterium]
MKRFALLVALVGCGSSQTTGQIPRGEVPASEEAPEAMGEEGDPNAPTPFTAAQIRDACPPGRVDTFRLSAEATMQMAFGEHTATGVRFTTTVTAGSQAAEPEEGEATWEELRLHASYPAEATTIAEETVETPAGSFRALHYTVVDADAQTTTHAWFAHERPGPPVRHRVENAAGEVMSEMILESFTAP